LVCVLSMKRHLHYFRRVTPASAGNLPLTVSQSRC
jgi:hypothetical protein